MKQVFFAVAGLSIVAVLMALLPVEQSDNRDVLYGPTPYVVVDAMLDMAGVGKGDTVYDLGCGDGRIVVAAAQRGAKCVGVDIDSKRVEQSRENVRKARVEDSVELRRESFFDTDISEATVITIFLNQRTNLNIRSKLLTETNPGTRLVSHKYHMGDWLPDETAEVDGHTLYYWVIPSGVAGRWEGTITDRSGKEHNLQLHISQRYQEVLCDVTVASKPVSADAVSLVGDKLAFTLPKGFDNHSSAITLHGRVKGESIKGSISQGKKAHGLHWRVERVEG